MSKAIQPISETTRLIVFTHHHYGNWRGRLGLHTVASMEVIEEEVAKFQLILDETPIAEDRFRLLFAAPVLADLGYGKVVEAPLGTFADEIDMHWNWEQLVMRYAPIERAEDKLDPCYVTQMKELLVGGFTGRLAQKYLPDVAQAYEPKAKRLAAIQQAIADVNSDDCLGYWYANGAGDGIRLEWRADSRNSAFDDLTFLPNAWTDYGGNAILEIVQTVCGGPLPDLTGPYQFPYFQYAFWPSENVSQVGAAQ